MLLSDYFFLTSFHELICVREMKVHYSGNFPFQSHWARNINWRKGLWTTDWHNSQCTQIITEKEAYLACKTHSNRPNRQVMLYPIQTLWESRRFDSGISISFKRKCNIIMQIQYTKNINPGRFELNARLSKPTSIGLLCWNEIDLFRLYILFSHFRPRDALMGIFLLLFH